MEDFGSCRSPGVSSSCSPRRFASLMLVRGIPNGHFSGRAYAGSFPAELPVDRCQGQSKLLRTLEAVPICYLPLLPSRCSLESIVRLFALRSLLFALCSSTRFSPCSYQYLCLSLYPLLFGVNCPRFSRFRSESPRNEPFSPPSALFSRGQAHPY